MNGSLESFRMKKGADWQVMIFRGYQQRLEGSAVL